MTRDLNDVPVWLPGLHRELSLYAEHRRVPRDECPGIADEALGITLAKRWDDPCLYAPKPSEEFRQLSFVITRNLAVDFHRRAEREGPFRAKPDTSDEDGDTSADVPAENPPVGHELEVKDEVDLLRQRLRHTAERFCAPIEDPYRKAYTEQVLDEFIEQSEERGSRPTGRSLGKLMTERGLRKEDGEEFPEQTPCYILYDFMEMFVEDYPEDP